MSPREAIKKNPQRERGKESRSVTTNAKRLEKKESVATIARASVTTPYLNMLLTE